MKKVQFPDLELFLTYKTKSFLTARHDVDV